MKISLNATMSAVGLIVVSAFTYLQFTQHLIEDMRWFTHMIAQSQAAYNFHRFHGYEPTTSYAPFVAYCLISICLCFMVNMVRPDRTKDWLLLLFVIGPVCSILFNGILYFIFQNFYAFGTGWLLICFGVNSALLVHGIKEELYKKT